MLESRLAVLVQQMGEVADEKREDQGCYSLKRKTNTLELAGLCRGNGDAKIKITGEKKNILMAMLWKTTWKLGKEGDIKEDEE